MKTVFFEEAAAPLGVLVATVGVAAHQLTGNSDWEAIASVAIGFDLAYVAFERPSEHGPDHRSTGSSV